MQDFHKVRAWQKAHALAISIRRLTDGFPRTGYARLRNQMIAAAESIADNIAEGCGAATSAEFARFLDMSIKSTSELENQLERGHGYKVLRTDEWRKHVDEVCLVRKMTWGLRRTVLSSGEIELDPTEDERTTGQENGEPKTENGRQTTDHGNG
ncbi:MAG TPA: four helix bundle protein [Gemmatimonadaceae bacterium]